MSVSLVSSTHCLCFTDRELTTSKRKVETDATSQRSVIEESKSRITMLENVLAKEAVLHFTASTCVFRASYIHVSIAIKILLNLATENSVSQNL